MKLYPYPPRMLTNRYVYNVEAEGDYSLFIGAIRRALDNPIDPYVSSSRVPLIWLKADLCQLCQRVPRNRGVGRTRPGVDGDRLGGRGTAHP